MNTTTLLKKLVEIESYSGQEQNLAGFIMTWAKEMSIPVELQDNNVLIKFLGGSPKALIFDAHMDTVKPGSLNFWSDSPTGIGAGKMNGGKLYGLGASDDKSAIAALLTLAHQLNGFTLPIDVFIVFVTNEEISGAGSQSFVNYFQKKYADKYTEVEAIIGEPTNLASIEIGHRGNIFLKTITYGDSGHSSKPVKIKKHAVYENLKTIQKVSALGEKLSKKYEHKVLGAPSICLTGIQSDSPSVNKIPSSCYSTWDVRTTPKLHNKLMHLIQKEVGNVATIEYMSPPAPFGFTSPNSKIISLFKELVPNVEIKISPASNDICFFTQAGIPTVTFGPGNKDVIHKPNEYVEMDRVNKSVVMYKQAVYLLNGL